MLNDNIVESVLLLSLNRFVCLILMVIFSHFPIFPIFSHIFPYFPYVFPYFPMFCHIFQNVLPLQTAIFWVSHGTSEDTPSASKIAEDAPNDEADGWDERWGRNRDVMEMS